MCRRNQLWGWILAAFGLGFLIGSHLEACFLWSCVGIGIIIFGFTVVRKK